MADFLETSITYYALAARVSALSCAARDLQPADESRLIPSFEENLRAIAVFLDEALACVAELRLAEEEALSAVVGQHAAELRNHAEQTFAAVAAAADQLLPSLDAGEPLQASSLCALNAAVRAGELRWGDNTKSDAIPEQLLAAEPGSKLYPNLLKKVRALCSRDLPAIEFRGTDSFKSQLLQGGVDIGLDARRSELGVARSQNMHRLFVNHALALSPSDHMPVHVTVPVGAGVRPLSVLSWNVLEFPRAGASQPVLDGVSPYCDGLLKALERKGGEERSLLLEAMSSEPVVLRHSDHVLEVVRRSMEGGAAAAGTTAAAVDVALLQEIGGDFRERALEEWCGRRGWCAYISSGSGDSSKCDAATGIVSKEAFDEMKEVAIEENKKVRYFAAVRKGITWLVSCHVPLVTGKKNSLQEDSAVVGARVLERLWDQLLGAAHGRDRHGEELVVGGDFNADVREVCKRVAASPPEGCSEVTLHMPPPPHAASSGAQPRPTCFGVEWPIDGVLHLRRR